MANSRPKTIPEEDNVEDWDQWDPMKDDYHSTRNTLHFNPEQDPEAEVTGEIMTNKIGGKNICHHYLKHGSCADGKYCDRVHITPKARDQLWSFAKNYQLNRDRLCLTYSYLSPIELAPDNNRLLLVFIVDIKSPGDFVFIAPYEQMDFSNFKKNEIDFYTSRVRQTSSYKTKLNKCHEQLAALFDHDYRIDNVDDNIYLSQIVACKLDDGRFCRSMVIGLEDILNDIFDFSLFLIDVGVVVKRPRELIYDLKANCLSEPPMAVQGRLNLRPTRGETIWSDEILHRFKSKVMAKKYFLCKIKHYSPQERDFIVDLYDIQTRASLTEKMIDCGLAEPCMIPRVPQDFNSWDLF